MYDLRFTQLAPLMQEANEILAIIVSTAKTTHAHA
jgi:hypothetical protein